MERRCFPDYDFTFNLAFLVIKHFNLCSFPIPLEQVVSNLPQIRLCPYSTFCKNRGLTSREAINYLGSNFGAIVRPPMCNQYILYYNDDYTPGTVRYTIAHELGHYFLGHMRHLHNKNRGHINHKNPYLDREADNFAMNLLAPAALIDLMGLENAIDINVMFVLGRQAFSRANSMVFDKQKITQAQRSYFFNTFETQILFPDIYPLLYSEKIDKGAIGHFWANRNIKRDRVV